MRTGKAAEIWKESLQRGSQTKWNPEHQKIVCTAIPDLNVKMENHCDKKIACQCCLKYGSCKAPEPKTKIKVTQRCERVTQKLFQRRRL